MCLVLEVGLEHKALRDVGDKLVIRHVEPSWVYPGNDPNRKSARAAQGEPVEALEEGVQVVPESPEIPPDLVRDLPLLHLDRDLATVRQPRPVYLRHARAGPRRPLHHALALLSAEADAKHRLDAAAAKVLADDARDRGPRVLRRVVEHAGEHALELGRQDGALHGHGLADLEVQAAVGAQQLEQAARAARVQLLDGAVEPGVRAEVELVVGRHDEAEREGARAAPQRRVEERVVEERGGAGQEGEVGESAGPSAAARAGFAGRRTLRGASIGCVLGGRRRAGGRRFGREASGGAEVADTRRKKGSRRKPDARWQQGAAGPDGSLQEASQAARGCGGVDHIMSQQGRWWGCRAGCTRPEKGSDVQKTGQPYIYLCPLVASSG